MTNLQIQDIPIDKIGRPVKLRERCSRANLASLWATMQEHGQLCPVLLTPPSEDGLYGLLDGSRRVTTARINGAKSIRGIVLEGDISEPAAIEMAFIINTQREELNPIARAKAVAMHTAAKGSSASESAARLGLDASIGSKLVQLLGLPLTIQEQIASGAIPWTAGYQLTLVKDATRQAELAAKVADKQVTRDELAAEVAIQKKGRKKRQRKAAGTAVIALAGGRKVAVSGSELSLDVALQCLEEALEQLRHVQASGGDLGQLKRLIRNEGKANQAA